MGKRLRRLKKIRLHHEGTRTLVWGALGLIALNLLLFYIFPQGIIFYIVFILSIIVYCTVVNFYRCPIRIFDGETDGLIVAPADGHIVVIEEVEENEYFHDRRMMVSIFMSLFNVHANWIPVDGKVRMVKHQNGNFHRAWLPKASEENERSTILITATNGEDILVRQVAGAVARRIVTYAQEGEECYIDEHLGFIKLGSRVDLYLPLGTKIEVEMGQRTIGNETVIAHLAPSEEKDEEL
ncbi:MAG: phosphatidylserine decarboxylase family protein [Bacteroidaceae bacterium]|nr:phosphatidylserine decarboxylase family protein [Bacteroidaceae bacterium]